MSEPREPALPAFTLRQLAYFVAAANEGTIAGAAEAQLATLAAFGLRHDGDIAWQSRRGAH